MAANLPVEGTDGPFVGERVSPVATCDVSGQVADARRALDQSGASHVVIVAGDRLAVGEVDAQVLDGHDDAEPLLDVMAPVPSTYWPSVTIHSLARDGGGRFLVTTSEGRLLGVATVEGADHDHDHDHDHDDDHDHEDVQKQVEEVLAAVDERFGDRQPSEDELRAFLRDRLVEEGRSQEDADRFLRELE